MIGPDGGTRQQWKEKKGQPGLEHPGENEQASNRATRTGTSGGPKLWTGTPREEASNPGFERSAELHKEEEVAGAGTSGRSVTENMNKSKERDHVGGRIEESCGK